MVTSSYPKYEGDVTAPFVESIATSVAAAGHEVHVLAPYPPELRHAPSLSLVIPFADRELVVDVLAALEARP